MPNEKSAHLSTSGGVLPLQALPNAEALSGH